MKVGSLTQTSKTFAMASIIGPYNAILQNELSTSICVDQLKVSENNRFFLIVVFQHGFH